MLLDVHSRRLTIDAFGRLTSPFLQVESIVVDRSASRGWARILNDENFAARLRLQIIRKMRIRVKDHRPWSALAAADLKRPLQDQPTTEARKIGSGQNQWSANAAMRAAP